MMEYLKIRCSRICHNRTTVPFFVDASWQRRAAQAFSERTRNKGQIPLAATDSREYSNRTQITFDKAKREKTLVERGLDFERCGEVFAGDCATAPDGRQDYGEVRMITVGRLDDRVVVVVWTPRGEARRIISMRKANEREIARTEKDLD